MIPWLGAHLWHTLAEDVHVRIDLAIQNQVSHICNPQVCQGRSSSDLYLIGKCDWCAISHSADVSNCKRICSGGLATASKDNRHRWRTEYFRHLVLYIWSKGKYLLAHRLGGFRNPERTHFANTKLLAAVKRLRCSRVYLKNCRVLFRKSGAKCFAMPSRIELFSPLCIRNRL